MGRPLLSASLFVGSLTQRTMLEWLKVFRIVDNKSLIEEIKQSKKYTNDKYTEENLSVADCVYYINFKEHMKKLEDILDKANLKFGLDYMYQEEEFYIGRPLQNVREDISSDILFWQQLGVSKESNSFETPHYEIKDIDIFAAMYSERGGIEYRMTREGY